MKILLHICCAPCLIYPLERLREKGNEVTGLFYNPNIHPLAECDMRRQAVADYSNSVNLEVMYPEYKPEEFFRAVNMKEYNSARCYLCWALRLKQTAKLAKDNKFDSFTSTLLVSPYQDQELIHKIGHEVARAEGVEFYYEDFRAGFRSAHDTAREKGIYRQRYCGCIYSEIERCKQSGKH